MSSSSYPPSGWEAVALVGGLALIVVGLGMLHPALPLCCAGIGICCLIFLEGL